MTIQHLSSKSTQRLFDLEIPEVQDFLSLSADTQVENGPLLAQAQIQSVFLPKPELDNSSNQQETTSSIDSILDEPIQVGSLNDADLESRTILIALASGAALVGKYALGLAGFPLIIPDPLFAAAILILAGAGIISCKKYDTIGRVMKISGIALFFLVILSTSQLDKPPPPGLILVLLFACIAGLIRIAGQGNSKLFAAFAVTAGFALPFLLLGSQIDPIYLFAYYLAVTSISFALVKDHHLLLLGLICFIFTSSAAFWTAWAPKTHTGEMIVQLLIGLFFASFITILLLSAQRKALRLKNPADCALLFGVPIVLVCLEAILVDDPSYRIAGLSCMLSLFYALLFFWGRQPIWHLLAPQTTLLTDIFYLLSIIFAAVAASLGLEAQFAVIVWVLLGTLSLWSGVRHGIALFCILGMLLQLLAVYLLLLSPESSYFWHVLFFHNTPMEDGKWLIVVSISGCAILSAWLLHQYKIQPSISRCSTIIFIWGLLWWLGYGIAETISVLTYHGMTSAIFSGTLIFLSFSALLLAMIGLYCDWATPRITALLFWPLFLGFLVFQTFEGQQIVHFLRGVAPNTHPLANGALFAFILAAVTSAAIAYWFESYCNRAILSLLHIFSLFLGVGLVAWECAWLISWLTAIVAPASNYRSWQIVSWLGIGAFVLINTRIWLLFDWPIDRHLNVYLRGAFPGLAFFLLGLTIIYNIIKSNQPETLVFPPLLNPFDIVQLFVFYSVFVWLRFMESEEGAEINLQYGFPTQYKRRIMFVSVISLFIWANSIILRTLHYALQIPLNWDTITTSYPIQIVFTVFWALSATFCLYYGTRHNRGWLWLAGILLMSFVAVKLVIIDTAGIEPAGRVFFYGGIVLLVLLIGYFLPLPSSMRHLKHEDAFTP